MNLKSHLELFLMEGKVDRIPTPTVNGAIIIHDLEIELFFEHYKMPDEVIHEGDLVYFFLVATRMLTESVGFQPYSAVNVSRFRRRVFLNSPTSNRPCTMATTIDPHLDSVSSLIYNYTINEFNETVITTSDVPLHPFDLITQKESIRHIPCPYNSGFEMQCRELFEIIPDKWE